MKPIAWSLGILGSLAAFSSGSWGEDAHNGNWPMWGGKPARNMVSSMTGLPESWDVESKKNVKWVSGLGSQTYGNPVVAAGKVFLGSNNEALYDKEVPGDKGVLLAFTRPTESSCGRWSRTSSSRVG